MTQDRQAPIATHVFLRVEHGTVGAEEISGVLGLASTLWANKGQVVPTGDGLSLAGNVWALSSMWSVQSSHLDDHFEWLLARVGSRGAELQALRDKGCRTEIHCVWMGPSGYSGPELKPEVLRGLAVLGARVSFHFSVLNCGTGVT